MENPAKKVLMTSNGDNISHSIAFHLAKHGCRLVLMGKESSLRSMVDNIRDTIEGSYPIELIEIDMEADSEEYFNVSVHKASSLLGNFDAFINCYIYHGKTQDMLQVSEEEFKKTTKININATWFLMKAVANKMKEHGTGGSIVLMSTIASAERGLYPGSVVYNTASAGIHQLVRASALSLGKHKIRVNMVTRGLHLEDEFLVSLGRDRALKRMSDGAPLGEWLNPEEDLYSTVIYLISNGSKFMTGTSVVVDGGQSLVGPRLRSFM
ncbi:unnamed protein product [Cochlearia groenlandica]